MNGCGCSGCTDTLGPAPLEQGCLPWPVDPNCLPRDWPRDENHWTDAQRSAVAAASQILRALTGGVYGPCPKFVRPCSPDGPDPCTGPCGCAPVCTVTLGAYVSEILMVHSDGRILPDDAYWIYNWSILTRTDGGCFPACQRIDLPLSAPGTFGISYLEGLPVDNNFLAKRAVTRLAAEIWKDCLGGTCALPERVTQVVREGVTYQMADEDIGSIDRFGIAAIDQFLDVVNPSRLRRPLGVVNLDGPRWYYPTSR